MLSHLSIARALCVAGIFFSAFIARAQNPAVPSSGGTETVIRSETRVVLVDAAVVDRNNRFTRDLTQKDFRIWEDNKEQKITSFSLESASVTPDRSSRHYIVLFFDASTLGPSTLMTVRQDAFRFVEGFASPDRYMAVIAYGGDMQVLQNFTPDAARLKDALARLQNFAGFAANAAAPPAGGGRGRGAATTDGPDYRHMLAALRAVANSVADIRGRKALVLFSGGVATAADITTDITATIDACNKANVAVYGVIGRGLIGELQAPASKRPERILASLGSGLASLIHAAGPGSDSVDGAVFGFQRRGGGGTSTMTDASGAPMNSSVGGPAARQDVIRALAAGTGGLMLGTSNNLPEELGRIAQEQDDYYLLGYTPTVESAEGTCHALRVKVDRSGLEVHARKGYCTSKPDLMVAKPTGNDLEARAASGPAGNIAVRAQLPWFYSAANAARVSLAVDIVPTAMEFQKDQGKLHGELNLLGVAYKADGSVAARLSDTVKLDFASQQEADAFLKTPYHYVNQFEIVPGQYNFRVAISSGAHGFGKADLPLTIGPWNGQDLSMSGLALSRDAHPVAPQAGDLDELLLDRARPLVYRGMEVVPTGTSQFRTGEKGFFYFEVYEAPLKPRQIAVRVRILDPTTGRQINDSGPLNADSAGQPGSAMIPVAMKLPVVSAGAYKLEVSVVDGTDQPAVVRTADFDVF